ncbi:hypothetical protein [Halosimplex halobium]|uniref:hypothetical protein n=1 Tax=Halosimplex halobium TaxID=3396618 RepID=UPI003F54958D
MFDRIREMVGTEDNTKSYEINPQEVISAFERFLEREGVAVNQEKSDVMDEFVEIVNRYDNIGSELQQAQENIGDENGISLLDQMDNDQFDRWQKNHEHTIEEVESLNEDIIELLNKIDVDESRLDESGPFSEVTEFIQRVSDAHLVFSDTSNT